MRNLTFSFLVLAMLGCASTSNPPQHAEPSYWDLSTTYVLPNSEAERQEECGRIRHQMAKVVSRTQAAKMLLGSPVLALAAENQAREEFAALEARAAQVGCTAAFSSVQNQITMTFDQCFEKCKKYTQRSDSDCFDSCRENR